MKWYIWKFWRFAWSASKPYSRKDHLWDGHGQWVVLRGRLFWLDHRMTAADREYLSSFANQQQKEAE